METLEASKDTTSVEENKSTQIEEDPKMYFVVCSDLKMGKGKIAAQVAHVAIKLHTVGLEGLLEIQLNQSENKEILQRFLQKSSEERTELKTSFIKWRSKLYAKVVLQAKKEEFLQLLNEADEFVIDAGKTQIPKNSITVLGWLPRLPSSVYLPKRLAKLKLL